MIDGLKFQHEEKKRIRHIKKTTPDTGVVPVRIDKKTVIFIKKGQDPEERKRIHLERVERFRNNPNIL